MKASLRTLAVVALPALASCSTYQAPRYSHSSAGQAQIRELQLQPVSMGRFTSSPANLRAIQCRQAGDVVPPDGQTFSEFVAGALKAELVLASAYDTQASNQLSGNLDLVDFNSGSGQWRISLTLRATSGGAVQTTTSHQGGSTFFGETACMMIAQALVPAVQDLLSKALASPELGLTRKPRASAPEK